MHVRLSYTFIAAEFPHDELMFGSFDFFLVWNERIPRIIHITVRRASKKIQKFRVFAQMKQFGVKKRVRHKRVRSFVLIGTAKPQSKHVWRQLFYLFLGHLDEEVVVPGVDSRQYVLNIHTKPTSFSRTYSKASK